MNRLLFSELTKTMKMQALALLPVEDSDPTLFTYAVDANNNVLGFQPKEALQLSSSKEPAVVTALTDELKSDMVPLGTPDPTPAQELTANDSADHERRMDALAESSIARAPAKQVEALKETAKEAEAEPDPVIDLSDGNNLKKITSGLRTANHAEVVK